MRQTGESELLRVRTISCVFYEREPNISFHCLQTHIAAVGIRNIFHNSSSVQCRNELNLKPDAKVFCTVGSKVLQK